jgi:hypothetical protein
VTPPGVMAVGTASVPGLLLAKGEQIQIGPGALLELTFDQWTALEGEFTFADRHFERSRPVFFRQEIPVGAVADGDAPRTQVESDDANRFDAVRDAFNHVRTLVHRALLLATAWPLPEPALSVTYIAYGPMTGRQIGPYGREHILYVTDGRLTLDASASEVPQRSYATLQAEAELPPDGAIAAALATLERTTRPEFSPLNRFMHEMIALEQLLLPDVRTKLTRTFAARAASFLVSSPDQLEDAVRSARILYKVRSELVHGGDVEQVLRREHVDLGEILNLGRWVLCRVLEGAMAWRATAPPDGSVDLSGLRAALDEVMTTPGTWHELGRRWQLST